MKKTMLIVLGIVLVLAGAACIIAGVSKAKSPTPVPVPAPVPDPGWDPDYMKPVAYIVLDYNGIPSESEQDALPLGIYMWVTKYHPFEETLTAVICNKSGYTMSYGESFWLERLDGDTWVTVEPNEPISWRAVSYELKDLEQVTITCDVRGYDPLTPGTWRLCKKDLVAEFTLFEEWTE